MAINDRFCGDVRVSFEAIEGGDEWLLATIHGPSFKWLCPFPVEPDDDPDAATRYVLGLVAHDAQIRAQLRVSTEGELVVEARAPLRLVSNMEK